MKQLRIRLIIMNFLQFFIWGSWLITIGAYWFQTLPVLYPDEQWSGSAFGALFSTMGWAALIMPSLLGIIADKPLADAVTAHADYISRETLADELIQRGDFDWDKETQTEIDFHKVKVSVKKA